MAVGDLNSTGFNSQISVLSDDLFIDKADKKGSSEVLLAEADVVKTLMAEKKPDIAEATAMTPADTPKDLDPGVREARSEEVKTVETVRALDRAVASESPENVEKARAAVLEQVPEETLSEAGRTLLDSAQALSEAPAATVVESTVAAEAGETPVLERSPETVEHLLSANDGIIGDQTRTTAEMEKSVEALDKALEARASAEEAPVDDSPVVSTEACEDYALMTAARREDHTLGVRRVLDESLQKLTMNADGTISTKLTDASVIFGSSMQGTALANAGMKADNEYVNKLLTDESGNIANLGNTAVRFDAAMNAAGALTTFTTAYDRASDLRQIVREEAVKGEGNRLWARVTGGKTKLKGISTGGADLHTKTNAYGLVIGGEAELSSVTLGAAFTAGTGDTKNSAVSGKDDFDFYGLSVYGTTTLGSVDVLADASVNVLKSDLTVGGVADVDTDVTTSVYSFGVQGQKTFALDVADITPFIGANIYHVRGGSYSNGHGAHVGSSNATAVEFPIGAKVSKDFETAAGLKVAPAFSLAVVPTVGNRDIDSKVKFAGAQSTYNYTLTDDVKVRTKLGVDATSGNFNFGLHAGYEWGNEERSSASVEASLKYMF